MEQKLDVEKVKKNMRSWMAQMYPGPNQVKETPQQKLERENAESVKRHSRDVIRRRNKLREFRAAQKDQGESE